MRLHYLGPDRGFSVGVSRAEVLAFRDSWPCSRIPARNIWFVFDARGNLEDMTDLKGYDGSDVLALSQDAQAWGEAEITRREREGD